MTALLSKDIKLLAGVMALSLFLAAMPFLGSAMLNWLDRGLTSANDVFYAGTIGMHLTLLSVIFMGGNAFCLEHVDGSEAFIAYLPISRRASIASKLIVCWGTILACWGSIMAVMTYCYLYSNEPIQTLDESLRAMPALAGNAVMAFGIAWFLSSIAGSTGTPSLFTILLLIVLSIAAPVIESIDFAWIKAATIGVSVVVGLVCTMLGCRCYIRRLDGKTTA